MQGISSDCLNQKKYLNELKKKKIQNFCIKHIFGSLKLLILQRKHLYKSTFTSAGVWCELYVRI